MPDINHDMTIAHNVKTIFDFISVSVTEDGKIEARYDPEKGIETKPGVTGHPCGMNNVPEKTQENEKGLLAGAGKNITQETPSTPVQPVPTHDNNR